MKVERSLRRPYAVQFLLPFREVSIDKPTALCLHPAVSLASRGWHVEVSVEESTELFLAWRVARRNDELRDAAQQMVKGRPRCGTDFQLRGGSLTPRRSDDLRSPDSADDPVRVPSTDGARGQTLGTTDDAE